ncbi:transcription termination/antitermination factor NusG [Candidatus Dojkabacteria bacterium]|nr:transcription termination/antitermination factor NusG [Candidatus Dojkabacteria bacterium]
MTDEKAKATDKVEKKENKKAEKPVEKKGGKPKKKKNDKLNWYILNTYSGHEKKVASHLEEKIKANEMEDKVTDVVVPIHEKIVVKDGKKRTVEEKLFPGYVLVQMEMDEDTWRVVRNTEGVTSFVGTERKPTPLNKKEVESILAFMDVKQPAYTAAFAVGDAVRVGDGPFKDFVGSISEINEDKGQVKVLLSVFGRETPVVLDFLQVNKL